eukprot:TRINITY_DN4046_c0_g1_i2.p1 TRINITY_DN4046_c0_g1~~TRINITY_DN4046_c0_g1_i2.p1  ORF type:complete len:626 (+),score=151.19 TRINITY_DN4046_c0_g1_i2:900-2777(+)
MKRNARHRFRKVHMCTNTNYIEWDDKQQTEEISKPDFTEFLSKTAPIVEYGLVLNETMDPFQPEFVGLMDDDITFGNKYDSLMKEVQAFSDHSKSVAVTALDWQPGGPKGGIAVALSSCNSHEEHVIAVSQDRRFAIQVWNLMDTMQAQFVLEAPYEIMCFRFVPDSPHSVVAGAANGQVFMWDLRQGRGDPTRDLKSGTASAAPSSSDGSMKHTLVVSHTLSSAVDKSHRAPVCDLVWTPYLSHITESGEVTKTTQNQHQFVTVAADGSILVWDITGVAALKDLEWVPIFAVNQLEAVVGVEYAFCRVWLNAFAELVLTTQSGDIVAFDWSKRDAVRLDPTKCVRPLSSSHGAHQAAATGLHAHPTVRDLFLTAGDNTCCMWKLGVQRPLVVSPFATAACTACRWSPTRAAVFFVGKSNGDVDVWDLLDRSHTSCLSQPVSNSGVTSLEFLPLKESSSQLLAVGDQSGSVHIMDVPRNFSRSSPNEVKHMQTFVAREVERINCMEEREAALQQLLQQQEQQLQQQQSGQEHPRLHQQLLDQLPQQLHPLGVSGLKMSRPSIRASRSILSASMRPSSASSSASRLTTTSKQVSDEGYAEQPAPEAVTEEYLALVPAFASALADKV